MEICISYLQKLQVVIYDSFRQWLVNIMIKFDYFITLIYSQLWILLYAMEKLTFFEHLEHEPFWIIC